MQREDLAASVILREGRLTFEQDVEPFDWIDVGTAATRANFERVSSGSLPLVGGTQVVYELERNPMEAAKAVE